MFKKYFIIILLLLTVIVSISGCITKTATNGTFGEKYISLDSITVSNNTTSGNFTDNDGKNYYYIDGYLVNNNSNDAFKVKINATAYDSNGNVVGSNDTPYLNPISIPAKGISEFYVQFPDPNNNIMRYKVKIVNAAANL